MEGCISSQARQGKRLLLLSHTNVGTYTVAAAVFDELKRTNEMPHVMIWRSEICLFHNISGTDRLNPIK